MSIKSVIRRIRRTPEPVATVEVAVGVYNGEPMVSMLLGDGEWERECIAANERWWNGLTDAERAEHTAWEEAATGEWLAWAKGART